MRPLHGAAADSDARLVIHSFESWYADESPPSESNWIAHDGENDVGAGTYDMTIDGNRMTIAVAGTIRFAQPWRA